MDSAALVVSPDENISENELDTRAIPLELLAGDDGVLSEVAKITVEPSRVQVARFNSGS